MSKWEVKGLTKTYGDVTAIDNVSFTLEPNRIYGLIGNNGAGKTTLMKTIAHQLIPSGGDVVYEGQSIFSSDSYMREICLAREIVPVKTLQNYKVKQLIKIISYVYPNWDQEMCDKLLKVFPLPMKKRYMELSKGMQTMIGIIVGLSSRSPLTMFDEPYVGLDPEKREAFYEILLSDFEKHPRTILISTHLINEIENLFEKVLILKEGKLIVDEELDVIKAKSRLVEGNHEEVELATEGKHVIHRQVVGKVAAFTVFDEFTQSEKEHVEKTGATISALSLQRLFINLSKGDYSEFK